MTDETPPRRPSRKSFLLRLPPELHDELRGWANQELRSLNAHLVFLLREAARRRRGGAGSGEREGTGQDEDS
mgnify:CR=1 FL=1